MSKRYANSLVFIALGSFFDALGAFIFKAGFVVTISTIYQKIKETSNGTKLAL